MHVTHGIATLTATLVLRSSTKHAHDLARAVPGVITTRNQLTYHVDDLAFTGL